MCPGASWPPGSCEGRSAPRAQERLAHRPSGQNPRPHHRRPALPHSRPEPPCRHRHLLEHTSPRPYSRAAPERRTQRSPGAPAADAHLAARMGAYPAHGRISMAENGGGRALECHLALSRNRPGSPAPMEQQPSEVTLPQAIRAGPRREFQSPIRGRGLRRATSVQTPIAVRAKLPAGRHAPLRGRPLCPRQTLYTILRTHAASCCSLRVRAPAPPGWKLPGGWRSREARAPPAAESSISGRSRRATHSPATGAGAPTEHCRTVTIAKESGNAGRRRVRCIPRKRGAL